MATLKEIKERISSVGSTLKTTSAMKMVASAKLHRVQASAVALAEYERSLSVILSSLLAMDTTSQRSPLTLQHTIKRKAVVVALSSDTALCGGFNAQAIETMKNLVGALYKDGFELVEVVPIGSKIATAARKAGYDVREEFVDMFSSLDYGHAKQLADVLMEEYISGQVDSVYVVYNHFHSMGKQLPQQKQILPISLHQLSGDNVRVEYICEPKPEELLCTLIPYTLRMSVYGMLLDSATAEHAARTVAMQTASDNAQKLLGELRLDYNKRRQQAITDELADIAQIE